MLKHTPNFTQQKLESQLQSVVTSLERLTKAQQNNISNFAAYNAHSHDFRYDQHHGGQSTLSGPRHDSDHLAKLVRDEVRRQTRFIAPTTRPSNSGVPSFRNLRTADGLAPNMPGIFVTFRHLDRAMFLGELVRNSDHARWQYFGRS